MEGKEEMTWQQFLTENVLKECWHIWVNEYDKFPGAYCSKCKQDLTQLFGDGNRTFNNRNDLMDLYQAIEKDGKWDEFFWFSASRCNPKRDGLGCSETTAWLFCLSGEGYEDRCKMVAEFYGWEEKK